jgi:hypothetical protein
LPWTAEDSEAERTIFVVGSPRSGTTFLAGSLAAQAGVVDLGEVRPLKAQIPRIVRLPEGEGARRLRRSLEIVRTLTGARRARCVEQTPEVAFVLSSALRAYPEGSAVHALRDGRDVVCSLLERGWLSAARNGRDDAKQAFGAYPRFWVEDERRAEFTQVSDATRAAWAWRRYVEAARSIGARTFEQRYERLVTDPRGEAERLADFLGFDPQPLEAALGAAHARSVGRWQRELTREQVQDVEREAGPLLAELGYL